MTKYNLFPKWVYKLAGRHLKACFKAGSKKGSQIQARDNLDSLMLLNYYRNGLMHLFINEALIACSVKGFG